MSLIATTTNVDIVLIIAIVLFCVAGILRSVVHNIDGALVAFGLAVLALAFIVIP